MTTPGTHFISGAQKIKCLYNATDATNLVSMLSKGQVVHFCLCNYVYYIQFLQTIEFLHYFYSIFFCHFRSDHQGVEAYAEYRYNRCFPSDPNPTAPLPCYGGYNHYSWVHRTNEAPHIQRGGLSQPYQTSIRQQSNTISSYITHKS